MYQLILFDLMAKPVKTYFSIKLELRRDKILPIKYKHFQKLHFF